MTILQLEVDHNFITTRIQLYHNSADDSIILIL